MSARLQPGDPAPDFTLPDDTGGSVRLSDLRGGKVIVYFYPAAMTPGCTKEACHFRDLAAEFAADGIAANTLWPRTTIATAAVRFALGGDAMLAVSRTPEIYADAAHIVLTLDYDERGGELTVEDDGKGFPADRKDDREGGNGLRIMRHRAEVFGGDLAVGPGPTGGVRVCCRFPKA